MGSPLGPSAGPPELARGRRGCWAVITVCPPCLLQWGLLRREGGLGGEEAAVGGRLGRAMGSPGCPLVGSPELARGRRGSLGGYKRLSPVFAAGGTLEGGGVVMWLEGRRVAIVGVPGGWGGRGAVVRGAWLGRARGAPGVLRAAHRSWFGEGWGCRAVVAVCPPYFLQWEPWRRQGGFGEGWWCGWRRGGLRLRGFGPLGRREAGVGGGLVGR